METSQPVRRGRVVVVKMSCCSPRLRRTSPMDGSSSRAELIVSKPPRMNGWSWPLQPFQVLAWMLYGYLAIVSFGIYIPLLPLPWKQLICSLTAVAFIVHLFTHIAAVSIDPAEASVRAKQNYSSPMPVFDRSKQAHVIQDLRCYLCDVRVGPKVKHCGICNKCVEDFDHHCKWLNNCVGGRNYWCFFFAMLSATLGTLLLFAVLMFIFIQHYLHPESLRTAPQFDSLLGNDTWLMFIPLTPIKTSSASLLILAFITGLLSFISLLLLVHLLGFHLYLFSKGISTYEYIRLQRQKGSRNQDTEAGNPQGPKTISKSPQNKGNSIDCEPALSQRSSRTCNFEVQGPFSRHISESISTELNEITEHENDFQYVTGKTTAGKTTRKICMSDIKSWRSEQDSESQSSIVKCADSVPDVQDPLGSSVMTPHDQ